MEWCHHLLLCTRSSGKPLGPNSLYPKRKRNKGVVLTIVEGLLYLGRFHHTNYIIFKKKIQRNFLLMENRDFLILIYKLLLLLLLLILGGWGGNMESLK
jgi:hypothetical protein